MKKHLWLLIVLFMIGGCASEQHHFNFYQGEDTEQDSGTLGGDQTVINVAIFNVKAEVKSGDRDNQQNGSLTMAEEGAQALGQMLGGVVDKWVNDQEKPITETTTTTTRDSNNPINKSTSSTTSEMKLSPVIPDKPISAGDVTETSDKTGQAFHMGWIPAHNRAFVWLPETGSHYGGQITLTFNNECGALTVPNATNDYIPAGNAARYFCGTNNKPEESNGTRASVFSPVGCHATEVTIK